MKKICLSILSLLLVSVMLLHITGCSDLTAGNLTDGLLRGKADGKTPDESFKAAQFDFAAELFKLCAADSGYENTLVSPISVMTALAMTANGANGLTEEETEAVLGGGMSTEDLNAYLYAYLENLSDEVSLANSIWFKENVLDVNEAFLQTNKDYYDAEIFAAPFDQTTTNDVNAWVKEKTKNRIKKILDEVEADSVMYLINALTFDGEWMEKYEKDDVYDRTFTALDGTEKTVSMMYSEEYTYLSDENAEGFIKKYKGGNYAFAALLPDKDIDFSEFVNSLTGEKLADILSEKQTRQVSVGIPEFSYEYDIEMNNALQAMGMESAFDRKTADFSDIGAADGNLYIGKVLHKTFIEVDTFGTKAAAVTLVDVKSESAPAPELSVILDRPFVYMIIDTETDLPVFIGTMTNIK